jgi:hypothetical protein
MVLEQEQRKGRKKGIKYTPLDDFSHLRDAISHPEVGDRDVRKFLQANIGSEQLDLHNQEHVRFLEDRSWRLLEEARRIVEKNLASLGTLFWC